MTINDIRDMFPALGQQVYSRPLVYFDNAATSQRLENAVRRLDGLALGANANIHRAVHKLASDATEEYESTRDAVRDFLNAESREEIIFTSGTTASINLVAYSFGETFINEGDEIIVSEEEHHSNIVPWQLLCERKKAVLKVIGIDDVVIRHTDGRPPTCYQVKHKTIGSEGRQSFTFGDLVGGGMGKPPLIASLVGAWIGDFRQPNASNSRYSKAQ